MASASLVVPFPARRPQTVVLRGESLNFIVRQNPSLFYEQAWYRTEAFAGASHVGVYELAKPCPAAAIAKYYVDAYRDRGAILYAKEYVTTTDCDNEGHVVYVGRAAQFGGMQIHRKLSDPAIGHPDYPVDE